MAKANSLPVIFTHKDKLSRMVKQQPHQNIVLKCSPLLLTSPSNNHIFENGLYVFCDKITDPQNFGAILRSCLFFGVKGVFTGRKYHCPLNSTVSKASAGAAELIQTHLIDNST
jgi:tRNA G18 (ribose-2'-O)-methylase SpoU